MKKPMMKKGAKMGAKKMAGKKPMMDDKMKGKGAMMKRLEGKEL